jgi:hypothetical protein
MLGQLRLFDLFQCYAQDSLLFSASQRPMHAIVRLVRVIPVIISYWYQGMMYVCLIYTLDSVLCNPIASQPLQASGTNRSRQLPRGRRHAK